MKNLIASLVEGRTSKTQKTIDASMPKVVKAIEKWFSGAKWVKKVVSVNPMGFKSGAYKMRVEYIDAESGAKDVADPPTYVRVGTSGKEKGKILVFPPHGSQFTVE